MEELLEIRKDVFKQIEALRAEKKVGSSLDCMVSGPFTKWKPEDVLDVLVVSQIQLTPIGSSFIVSVAQGQKCERCFKILKETCQRCET